jgi:hypothetical protein
VRVILIFAFQLFTLYVSSGTNKNLRRYENGTRVSEFSDLRANPRCVVEGQALHLRKMVSLLRAQDDASSKLYSSHQTRVYKGAADCLGFDPCDLSVLPDTWIIWGRAAGNMHFAEVFSQVLGATILVDAADYKLHDDEHEQQGAASYRQVEPIPSRASVGACYLAVYLFDQHNKSEGRNNFHSTIEALKRGETSEGMHRVQTRRKSTLASVTEGVVYGECDNTVLSPTHHLCPIPTQRVRSVTTSNAYYSRPLPSPTQRERSSSTANTSVMTHPTSSSSYHLVTSPVSSEVSSPQSMTSKGPHMPPSETLEDRRGEMDHRMLIKLAKPDYDLWEFYGAMLEEHIRLADVVVKSNIV